MGGERIGTNPDPEPEMCPRSHFSPDRSFIQFLSANHGFRFSVSNTSETLHFGQTVGGLRAKAGPGP